MLKIVLLWQKRFFLKKEEKQEHKKWYLLDGGFITDNTVFRWMLTNKLCGLGAPVYLGVNSYY